MRDAFAAIVVVAGCILSGVLVAVASQQVLVLVGAAAAIALISVVSAISPRTAVILVFAVSTLSVLTFPTPIGVLRLDQAVVLPALGGVLARWAMDRDGAARVAGRAPTLIAVFLGLYVLANFVSTILMALDVASSLRIVLWLSLSFAAYLLTAVAAPRYVSASTLLNDVASVGMIATFVALVLYFLRGLGPSAFGVQFDPVSGQMSARGLFLEGNLLGSFAAMMAILAASQLVYSPRNPGRRRSAVIFRLGVSLAAAYVSLTRAAWLGLIVGALTLMFVARPPSGRTKIVVQGGFVFATAVAVLLVSGAGGQLVDRAASFITDSTGTIAFRSASFTQALNGVPDHLWLGAGTNSYGQHFLDPSQNYSRAYLAGLFVATLWDVGVVGLAALLLAFAALARQLRRVLVSSDDAGRSMAAGFAAAFMCGLAAYQATNGFWFAYNWILVGLAASVPVGITVRASQSTQRHGP